MILVDSNIPMYLVGAAHPRKADAQRLLERCVSERLRLVTDAEVLQVLGNRQLSARDAIHVAVMQREGVGRILSFDGGFDGVPGIERLS